MAIKSNTRREKIQKFHQGENQYYIHFSLRLLERYNLSIRRNEYRRLCNKKIELLYCISKNKRFGIITIKGNRIPVVSDKSTGLLNTCLFGKSVWPVPLYYKKRGVDIVRFNYDLDVAIQRINIVCRYLTSIDGDTKTLFVLKPFKYPNFIYGAAVKKYKGQFVNYMPTLVKNLYNEKQAI